MTERRIRVGVVGTGHRVFHAHAQPSAGANLCDVVAVASRDPDNAKAFADRWAFPRVHLNKQALLDDPEIDAVIIFFPLYDLNYAVTL